ncbi:MAG: hypothetical protein HRU43_03100 [Simkaniaceae bacterium]|nr:hypothetical protein [Simkaniaceae bacterium]
MKQKIKDSLKQDLHALHDDWEVMLSQDTIANDPMFLEKVAKDIQNLDAHATLALNSENLKEQAELVHFALSTPWGAPFIGETTLIEAAKTYTNQNPDSSLKHLLQDFIQYGHKKKVPLFHVLDEITEEIS